MWRVEYVVSYRIYRPNSAYFMDYRYKRRFNDLDEAILYFRKKVFERKEDLRLVFRYFFVEEKVTKSLISY